MVVKSKRGRRRYVAFTVDPSLTRENLAGKLKAFCGDSAPKVIQCAEGWCILRCTPGNRDDTVSMMSRIDPESRSLRTSGTLITLRRRYPRLMETRPPARRRPDREVSYSK